MKFELDEDLISMRQPFSDVIHLLFSTLIDFLWNIQWCFSLLH